MVEIIRAISPCSSQLACRHLITLQRAEAAGEIRKPVFHDPGAELLRELGNRHEQAFLRHLTETKSLEVVQIPSDMPWLEAVARTVEALRRGVGLVYQATFQDGPWGGRSDFLIRVDKPSALGPFSYEVVETKPARSAKARAILQLCFYSELLSKIQGEPPDWMIFQSVESPNLRPPPGQPETERPNSDPPPAVLFTRRIHRK